MTEKQESKPKLDLDELERLLATHRTSTDADAVTDAVVRLTRAFPRLLSELRQARARVEPLAMDLAALQGTNVRRMNETDALESRITSLESENERLRDAGDDLRMSLIAADHDPYEEMAPEDKPCPLCEAAARYDAAVRLTGPTPYESRIYALESEVARLREEAGLEQAVREALGERFFSLKIEQDHGVWWAIWDAESDVHDMRLGLGKHERIETLPALLRAILEVENKS